MIATLLSVIIPVFVVIAAGLALGYFVKPDLTSLNRIALYGTVPALVFSALANSELGYGSVGYLVAGQGLFVVVMFALAWLLTGRLEARSRRGFIATSLYGNSANMMLPITLFAFGEAGLERALVLFVISSVLLFTTGPLVLAGGRGAGRVPLGRVLRLPVLWAALLGIFFNATGLALPLGLARGIELLGGAAIPLVLLVLGLQIYKSGLPAPTAVNLSASAFRLVVGPFVAYAAGWLVGARALDLAVITLLAAMPPAVNVFMLALEFGGKAEEVAQTIVLSTFASLLTLAVVVWLLSLG